ncbi:hypothetical protein TNCV_2272671 [Trichonephila clavipes]|nr:hypothetical protein TNCV_2272671 [Trichonephila clavipes]
MADIRPQMLEKVIENWTSRLDYIRASRRSPMPEIIFKIFLDCDIHFSYVWGHSGNLGNDRADQLAKEVTCQDMNHLMSVPWSHWNYVAWERTVSSWNTKFLAPPKALWTKRFFPTIYQRLKCRKFVTVISSYPRFYKTWKF